MKKVNNVSLFNESKTPTQKMQNNASNAVNKVSKTVSKTASNISNTIQKTTEKISNTVNNVDASSGKGANTNNFSNTPIADRSDPYIKTS